MEFRPFHEIFKKIGYRDPYKLLAHTWWINGKITKFGGEKRRPWVCSLERHPDASREYQACPCSTKESSSKRWSISTPANVIPGLDKKGYILINLYHSFLEEIIDSGEHISDMPEYIKKEIRKKLQEWSQKR